MFDLRCDPSALLSLSRYFDVIQYTDHSVQRRFKSNTPLVLFPDLSCDSLAPHVTFLCAPLFHVLCSDGWVTMVSLTAPQSRAAFPKSIVSSWFQWVYDVLKLTMLLGNTAQAHQCSRVRHCSKAQVNHSMIQAHQVEVRVK